MVKKIHYCWFGGKKLPKKVKKCIATWKKFLPDYEIKEWNETNFDINMSPFVKEAYESKKWAFVSDYVRIYALYNEGGIYFDTDMKIIKDPKSYIDKDMFMGYEDSGYVGTAMIGTKEKENKYVKEILDYYNNIEHFNPEIMYNYANPVIITKILKQYEMTKDDAGIEIFDGNIYVYPRDYFYPISYNYEEKIYTSNTCMVHLFNATWADKGEKRVIGIYRKFGPGFGGFLNKVIDNVFNFKQAVLRNMLKFYNFLRMKYSIYINRNKRLGRIKDTIENTGKGKLVIYHPEDDRAKCMLANNFDGYKMELREQYTAKEASKIAKIINDAQKDTVIFNNIMDGWDKLITYIKSENSKIKIKVIIYDSYSQLSDEENWLKYNLILELYAKKKIDEIIVTNKDMYEYLKTKEYNVRLFVNNINVSKDYIQDREKSELTKIGLYEAEDIYVRNIYNQLCASGLLENYEIDCFPINYKIVSMARRHNINLIGTTESLNKEELYKKMAGNDINLFVMHSGIDSIRPIESLELGTICLVGKNNCFEGTELEKYIVVQNENNVLEIADKIKSALENKNEILDVYKRWKEDYDKNAKESEKEILSSKEKQDEKI